jgi:hypothetical protein
MATYDPVSTLRIRGLDGDRLHVAVGAASA